MKSSYLKLSNLYTPSISSNFVMKKYEELKIIYNDTDSVEDDVFHDLYIPFEAWMDAKAIEHIKT